MYYCHELRKPLLKYIDGDDTIDVKNIVKDINNKYIYDIIQLLGKISKDHPHFNKPDEKSKRICNVLEPLLDIIREEVVVKSGAEMKEFLMNFESNRDGLIRKVNDLQDKYSYMNCKFRRNTNEDDRDFVFRFEFLLDVVKELQYYNRDRIFELFSRFHDKYIEAAHMYKDEYLAYIQYDFTKVWKGF